jgi:hypothetical protein
MTSLEVTTDAKAASLRSIRQGQALSCARIRIHLFHEAEDLFSKPASNRA